MNTDGPQFTMVQLQFLTSQWCKSNAHSIETILEILNVDLFQGKWCVGRPSPGAGGWQKPQLPVSRKSRGSTTDTQTTYMFCLSLPTQYPIHYKRQSTLYYKISCVLADFAQLQTHVNVLSMVKIGVAKLWDSWVRSITCIFNLRYFQRRKGFIGM